MVDGMVRIGLVGTKVGDVENVVEENGMVRTRVVRMRL